MKPFGSGSEAPWIYEHPAMKRMKYTGGVPHWHGKCNAQIRNKANVVVEVVYFDRFDNEHVAGHLPPAGSIKMSVVGDRRVKLRRRRHTTDANEWRETKPVKIPCRGSEFVT